MTSLSRHPVLTLTVSALALLASSAYAGAQPAPVPTHCKAGEFAYLNANMAEVHRFPEPRGKGKKKQSLYELRKIGKLLSVCAPSSSAPLHSLSYRFGPPGRVDMEQVATASRKFHLFDRTTSPHTGEEVLFFSVGLYTYCVTAATGQGQGIGLTVLQRGRKMLDLFSGNNPGKDYEGSLAGLFDIDFSPGASPLERLEASEPFLTPCDATST
jgi:hypothetical protein